MHTAPNPLLDLVVLCEFGEVGSDGNLYSINGIRISAVTFCVAVCVGLGHGEGLDPQHTPISSQVYFLSSSAPF